MVIFHFSEPFSYSTLKITFPLVSQLRASDRAGHLCLQTRPLPTVSFGAISLKSVLSLVSSIPLNLVLLLCEMGILILPTSKYYFVEQIMSIKCLLFTTLSGTKKILKYIIIKTANVFDKWVLRKKNTVLSLNGKKYNQ